MTEPANPAEFVDRAPDERLLGEGMPELPDAEQRTELETTSRARTRLVAVGATLTGISLVGGIALIAFGVIDALSSSVRALNVAAVIIGVILVVTHWGWVHVAEGMSNKIESRRNRASRTERLRWLETIKPYTRYSVTTSVLDDGSIRIARQRHTPVRAGERAFTFVRETDGEEVHPADESGAHVAERAEELRRRAALDTERERERWQIAADAYESAIFDRDDEQQRLEARRAASRALSEQINAKLREPPLIE